MRGFWLFVPLMVLLIICSAVGVMIACHTFGLRGLLLGAACYLVFLLLAEAVTSVIYYTYAKFECAHQSTDA
jgi:hypothetical protein